jgi:DNA-binding NarL/FixJ family response regulator
VTPVHPLRILVADDQVLFRECLACLLRTKPEIGAVAEAGSLHEAAARIDEFHPDLLLLDLEMSQPVLADIPKIAARVRVIVVTALDRMEQMLAAIRAGARGIVSKGSAADTLLEAIQVVARGEVWLSSALQTRLVGALVDPSPEQLTAREREIVRLVALGFRNAEVGAKLFISAVTVKTHLSRVFEKLGVRDRGDLVLYAVRSGLIAVNEQAR